MYLQVLTTKEAFLSWHPVKNFFKQNFHQGVRLIRTFLGVCLGSGYLAMCVYSALFFSLFRRLVKEVSWPALFFSVSFAANAESMQTGRNRDSVRPQVHKQGSDHKPTRVRTVLNEKQLHTLRTCYAANPRPDALMKEQLVEMTGLSPRVIRVWFQNKRCKDKKKSIMMKQLQQQEKVSAFQASISYRSSRENVRSVTRYF